MANNNTECKRKDTLTVKAMIVNAIVDSYLIVLAAFVGGLAGHMFERLVTLPFETYFINIALLFFVFVPILAVILILLAYLKKLVFANK